MKNTVEGRECFEKWAAEHQWSDWTKPTLFAGNFRSQGAPSGRTAVIALEVAEKLLADCAAGTIRARNGDGSRNCVVIDCSGADSLAIGVSLIKHGFAPVVLFNGVASGANCLVRNEELVRAVVQLAPRVVVDSEPSPAFVLDSRRRDGDPEPGKYDNRWVTFPQDFPSAGRLRVTGISQCYLIAHPRLVVEDLAHVLLRWQQGGIDIVDASGPNLVPLTIRKPLWFRQVFYRWIVLMGLRPNSFGGFGAVVPTDGGGGFG